MVAGISGHNSLSVASVLWRHSSGPTPTPQTSDADGLSNGSMQMHERARRTYVSVPVPVSVPAFLEFQKRMGTSSRLTALAR